MFQQTEMMVSTNELVRSHWFDTRSWLVSSKARVCGRQGRLAVRMHLILVRTVSSKDDSLEVFQEDRASSINQRKDLSDRVH